MDLYIEQQKDGWEEQRWKERKAGNIKLLWNIYLK